MPDNSSTIVVKPLHMYVQEVTYSDEDGVLDFIVEYGTGGQLLVWSHDIPAPIREKVLNAMTDWATHRSFPVKLEVIEGFRPN